MSNSILANNDLVNKFFDKTDLNFYYSNTVVKHLKEFLVGATSKGFTAKTTDIAEYSVNHRTTIGHFLSHGVWNEKYIDRTIKKQSLDHVINLSNQTKQPIFVSTDDTVNVKTKPSSQVKSPIQKADFHHSHLLGKTVWGHQVLSTMVSYTGHNLNYDIHLYDKEHGSKIDYITQLSETLPTPPHKGMHYLMHGLHVQRL